MNRSTLGRVLAFGVVVAFMALLLNSYGHQKADTDRGESGSTTQAQTPAEQAPPGARAVPTGDTFVGDGLKAVFAVGPARDQNDLTQVSFTLTDPATGRPVIPQTPPAVWLTRQQGLPGPSGQPAASCEDRIRAYAQGTFDSRPEIDLSSYFVLVLNDDASISVIDPLNGVTGISNLYAMVRLAGRGEDWVLNDDGTRLFVSVPEVDQVAVIDTDTFEVVKNADVANTPTRMARQPDGRRIWIANEPTDGTPGGVTVIDASTFEVAARLATGTGPHEIAFSGDVDASHGHDPATESSPAATTSYAFIANREEGTVSVVDTRRLEVISTVGVGAPPTGLDYSPVGDAVYVAGEGDGGLTVIDAARHEIVGRVDTSPGVAAIRFAPGGRWGFAVSPGNSSVDVIDATTNRVVHTVHVDGAPDRVSFSAANAYVHASQKAEVALIDLTQVARPETLTAVRLSGGRIAPDRSPVLLSEADTIVRVHEHGGHMLIANPGDQAIYYYMEGMNAPMGAFETYGRTPRATLAVGREVRETEPGVYSATVRLPGSGDYLAAFQLDSPRVVHCFSFSTEPAAGAEGAAPPALKVLSEEREVKTGEPLALRISLANSRTNAPVSGLDDVQILATLASGQRSERFAALATDAGIYEARLSFVVPGIYNLYFTIPSRSIDVGDLPSLTLQVVDAATR